jgi:uncharacterized protein (DUF302 family)
MSYGFERTLAGVSFADAKRRVTAALAAQGFGVLTEIDVKATFKAKLDLDHRPYVILGACNPQLARQALEADPRIGLLLPCNVVVEEVAGGARVMIIDPRAMFQVVEHEGLEPVVKEADRRLRAALDQL